MSVGSSPTPATMINTMASIMIYVQYTLVGFVGIALGYMLYEMGKTFYYEVKDSIRSKRNNQKW